MVGREAEEGTLKSLRLNLVYPCMLSAVLEDQRAWGSLRGDLFTTVTVRASLRSEFKWLWSTVEQVNENGKKKAQPSLMIK